MQTTFFFKEACNTASQVSIEKTIYQRLDTNKITVFCNQPRVESKAILSFIYNYYTAAGKVTLPFFSSVFSV